jgi:hypothetical protein
VVIQHTDGSVQKALLYEIQASSYEDGQVAKKMEAHEHPLLKKGNTSKDPYSDFQHNQ